MTRCTIIVNPASRRILPAERLSEAAGILANAGWDVRFETSEHPGHATVLARAAADDGADVVIAHGGDGTVNEVLNGLAGTSTALAVLAGGTANVWAKEITISRKPLAAMRSIVEGERRRVDLGRAGDRYFLLMAGVGFDGYVVRNIGARLKRRAGALAYIVAGLPAALRLRGWAVAVERDGVPAETPLYWLVLGNTRSYGGLVRITPRALVNDGALDLVLMRHGGVRRILADGARLLLGRHERSPNIESARVSTLAITTPGIPMQLDGEYAGETPVRFEVVPSALDVIVPRGCASPLFRDGRAEI